MTNFTSRHLRCEGRGPQNCGCFNWVNLGKLPELEFRAIFSSTLYLTHYLFGWTKDDQALCQRLVHRQAQGRG